MRPQFVVGDDLPQDVAPHAKQVKQFDKAIGPPIDLDGGEAGRSRLQKIELAGDRP